MKRPLHAALAVADALLAVIPDITLEEAMAKDFVRPDDSAVLIVRSVDGAVEHRVELGEKEAWAVGNLLKNYAVYGIVNEVAYLFQRYAEIKPKNPAVELGDEDENSFEAFEALDSINHLRHEWEDVLEVLAERPVTCAAAYGSDLQSVKTIEGRLAKLKSILKDD